MVNLEIDELSLDYNLQFNQHTVATRPAFALSVQPGEFVAIVGPSGCGKTTLLNLIAGVGPLTHGKIRVGGQPVQGPGRDRAMVLAKPGLLPWRTVQANIAYSLELYGYPRREIPIRVQRFIDMVGLTGFEDSYPRTLTVELQQRVNLARALAVEPSLLLLDEPFAALDSNAQEILQIELQQIWLAMGQSILYATQHVDEALFLADRIVIMAPQPSRVQQMIKVDFPRPRPTAIKQHPTFLTLTAKIGQALSLAQTMALVN